MKAAERFRARGTQKIRDKDASDAPLATGDKERDERQVMELAKKIGEYQDIFYAEHRRKILIVLQGMDTSGKDGTIRKVFGELDPLGVRCVSFKVPTTVEREHDFLWRIHKEVPGQGEMAIFNRSHYEDVLVPAVHGLIGDKERKRRYAQIRDFEHMLAENGTVLLKFFLHISKAEQKKRLEARLANPDKHWKVDPNDLAERQYWNDYQQMYDKAIHETDADHAPWYVIPADSKDHRNLAIGSIVVETMKEMKLAYPPPNEAYFKVKVPD
ncbi:polyphosphate kinase 2 family protein [Noviherbaspirillum cavernae]|uniref:Polyphosphate kinase 2 family protein n=1 Tax=Noviherbaspirillum cavernae TaxID=2320862 RepID=A0A418X2K2_9BURK|nr:PPK2 family polyphosphate kinase [Noviherbaspirillum cavernae]RJG06697.1 polyphosphate kinase 2 family protein [Noviherbaspirillum cavernae]